MDIRNETWPRAPFIVGCGRSGTTVLRSVLDAHPDMAIAHESRFITHFDRRRRRYVTRAGLDAARFVEDLYRLAPRRSRVPTWGIDLAELRTHVSEAAPRTFADGVRAVFSRYASGQGKSRWGDKTPGYTVHMERLAELLPEAVFIHLIRDGRDVAASFLDVPFGPSNAGQAALYWSQRVKAARRASSVLGSRYCEVRYEDLVADPEGEIMRVLSFAALSFDSTTLRYFERQELAVGHGDQRHHNNVRRPLQAGLRNWRQELSNKQVEVFEHIAGNLLSELGYERASQVDERSLPKLRAHASRLAKSASRRGRKAVRAATARVARTGEGQ